MWTLGDKKYGPAVAPIVDRLELHARNLKDVIEVFEPQKLQDDDDPKFREWWNAAVASLRFRLEIPGQINAEHAKRFRRLDKNSSALARVREINPYGRDVEEFRNKNFDAVHHAIAT